ncbi:MAG: DUF4252 domain-containing protein [Planctomycetota bacterium]|jgi:hypothetical protein
MLPPNASRLDLTARRRRRRGPALAGLLAGLLVAVTASATDRDVTRHPGYVDGTAFADLADQDGRLIEINLQGKLLSMLVTRAVKRHDQQLAAILGELVSMRAVIAETGDNRRTIEHRMAELTGALEKQSWQRFVRVRESRTEDYAAYVHYRERGEDDATDEEEIDGLVVIGFTGGGELLFVNLVGRIDMDRIALLSERFGVPGLDNWMPPAPSNEPAPGIAR